MIPIPDPHKLEQRAKEKLSEGGWFYASSNAGQSLTHLANRQAFFRHKVLPRMLVDTNIRDTKTAIFGHKVSAPIGFAPIGICKIYNPEGELPVAQVAKELNIPYCLSTAGSQPIEDVGKANGDGTRFFQLYMPHDDELTISLLQRAHDSGFTACILTVDTWQLGWRHNDVATSDYAFYKGIGADLGLSDPVFQKRLKEAGIDPKKNPKEAGAMWIENVWHGRSHSWEKIPWLIKTWKEISGGKPFAIKGVQRVDDAQKCVEVGCDGIVVSNHAGRQVDGAIASLDALEKIVDGMHLALILGHCGPFLLTDTFESCWRQNIRNVRLRRPRRNRRVQSPRDRRKVRLCWQTVSCTTLPLLPDSCTYLSAHPSC